MIIITHDSDNSFPTHFQEWEWGESTAIRSGRDFNPLNDQSFTKVDLKNKYFEFLNIDIS